MRSPMLLLCAATTIAAQTRPAPRPLAVTPDCSSCATWNAPQPPVHLHGDTWYVGTRGLTALLITSPRGHVLLDGGLGESAPLVAASIRAAGFRLEDVKLIGTSHVHYDHAGGVAQLQRASGARVVGLGPAAATLRTGRESADDPQRGQLAPIAPVARVTTIRDRDTVQVGPLVLTAHHTGGHTAGGTTWTWTSCDSTGCRDFVYGDSQSPISATGYRFTDGPMVDLFRAGHARLESLSCDILVTPHPEATGLWQRLERRSGGDRWALVDREACRRYAATARAALEQRLSTERPR